MIGKMKQIAENVFFLFEDVVNLLNVNYEVLHHDGV